MALKLPRTIRLDPSDTFVYRARGGARRMGGDRHLPVLRRRPGAARRQGAAGVPRGLSRHRQLRLVDARRRHARRAPEERAAAVERLAEQLVARCGAPDLGAARAAAEEEVAFAQSLCDHQPNTLLGLQRTGEGDSVRESFRTLHRRASRLEPIGAFRFVEVEEEAPGEEVDLVALARKARP